VHGTGERGGNVYMWSGLLGAAIVDAVLLGLMTPPLVALVFAAMAVAVLGFVWATR
jgi:hypothetical protein